MFVDSLPNGQHLVNSHPISYRQIPYCFHLKIVTAQLARKSVSQTFEINRKSLMCLKSLKCLKSECCLRESIFCNWLKSFNNIFRLIEVAPYKGFATFYQGFVAPPITKFHIECMSSSFITRIQNDPVGFMLYWLSNLQLKTNTRQHGNKRPTYDIELIKLK